ncbi:serine hydrolase domain-containing protein [Intrasporangium sp. DVR]|uniref:serine hydrolase domain-containing protein n=1 Tax=Intrasporangium sp. DVR TaxID=3127867 RepID=UPI00333F78F4
MTSDARTGLLDPATGRHLDRLLAALQRDSRLPSVAAGIVRDGGIVWAKALGTLDGRATGEPADLDTQYRMGSITKTFVAVAVLRLRDAGRLDLEDRLEAHVPGSRLGGATVAQLLSHAGGVQAETNGPWWERTPGGPWAELADSPVVQRFRPGRRFHYSNVGYAALGELLARAHGESWFDVVRRELLEPLEMRRTTTRPEGRAAPGWAVHPFADVLLPEPEHDAGAMAPAGQLWTTVEDLAKWAVFAAGDTGDVLDPDTLSEMAEPHVVGDNPGQPWTVAHGLGWQVWNVEGRRAIGHGGSMPGFLAGLRVDVKSGDGLVSFTNSTGGPFGPQVGVLLTEFREREPKQPEPWHAAGDVGVLDLVGLWHWGPTVTMATGVGEHLVLGEPGQGRGSRFERVAPDEWRGLDGYHLGEPLRVIRRPDGTVSHLDLQSFRLTRTPYDPEADVPGGVADAGWA